MNVLKFKYTYVFFIVFILLGMISCKKSSRVDDKNAETVKISENDLSENNEDLLNVDYREFYDELAPHGEWIEVKGNDIGIDLNKGSSSKKENSHRSITLNDLFGVKDAYADDVAFGAFFIWRPSPNLAISVMAGEPEPYYVPYANGQWVYTDAGWYFSAPTHYEEIVHHYGRWVLSPTLGWVWVPGRVWAPAWVEWRVSAGYIGWAPIPPAAYIEHYVFYSPVIPEYSYIIVEDRYFCDPFIYKHWHKHPNFRVSEMNRVEGIVVINNRIYNRGPEVTIIENKIGSKIETVKINKVKSINDSKRTKNKIYSYAPDFRRIKNKTRENSSAFQPGKFKKFSEVNNRNKIENSGKEKGSNNDNITSGSADRKKTDKNLDKRKNNTRQFEKKQDINAKDNFNKKNRNTNPQKFSRDKNKSDSRKNYRERQKKNNNSRVTDKPNEKKSNDNNNKQKFRENTGKNKQNNDKSRIDKNKEDQTKTEKNNRNNDRGSSNKENKQKNNSRK